MQMRTHKLTALNQQNQDTFKEKGKTVNERKKILG